MSLTTKVITEQTADSLAFLSDAGFRYYRSFAHFRRTDSHGFSYILINSVTHNRTDYYLAFYIGVRNDPLEATIKKTLQQPLALTHWDRSILNYTANIGPTSHGWRYAIPGTWTFRTARDVEGCSAEVVQFTRELALPFLNRNDSSSAIRSTLLDTPSHAMNPKPFQQILAPPAAPPFPKLPVAAAAQPPPPPFVSAKQQKQRHGPPKGRHAQLQASWAVSGWPPAPPPPALGFPNDVLQLPFVPAEPELLPWPPPLPPALPLRALTPAPLAPTSHAISGSRASALSSACAARWRACSSSQRAPSRKLMNMVSESK